MKKTKNIMLNKKEDKEKKETGLPQRRFVSVIAEEVAKTLAKRLPGLILHPTKRNFGSKKKKLENPIFLDTSAIIDGRIFDVIGLGVFAGTFVVLDSILLELKHIADSQDMVKRVRGRKGLDYLEKLKKWRKNKVVLLPDNGDFKGK